MATDSDEPNDRNLDPRDLHNLYASLPLLDEATRTKLRLESCFDGYSNDPLIASKNPGLDIDAKILRPLEAVNWRWTDQRTLRSGRL